MARAEALEGWSRAVRRFDPLLPVWRLLTSVRFALVLIAFLVLAGLLGTVLPQIPSAMRDNLAAIRAWLAFQEGKFGPLTEPMYRLGLFNVFAAPWFLAGLGLLVVSICLYIVSRLPAAWRSVVGPQERVPDSFFERAANRLAFPTPAASEGGEGLSRRLEAALRRRRFQVRRFESGSATYLFADRFAWAQVGTFVSHLALILFLAGGLLSRLGGYEQSLLIGEGTSQPVFAVSHPDQMQVEVIDAVGKFDAGGNPLDYRTELAIYQGGRQVARGVATVNDPLSYRGYRFHQASYFGEGVALRVRDAATGRTLYREVLPLEGLVPAPVITVRDGQGQVLLDDIIPPTDFIEGASGALITVPGSGRQFWVGVKADEREAWRLILYERGEASTPSLVSAGGSYRAGDLEFTFREATGLPALRTAGIPGDNQQALVIMSETPEQTPYLTMLGPVDGRALILYPDQPVRMGDREYGFEGRREFAGIQVKRDPGANFIWVAAGLLLAGLMITFYVPRLRLWARVGSEKTVLAGLAEKSGSFQAEARRLAEGLGAAGPGEDETKGEQGG